MEKFVLRCKIIYIFFLNIEKCTTIKQKKTEKLTVHICISLRFTQWIRLRRQWQSAVKMFNISALCLEFEWFRDNSSLPHTHTHTHHWNGWKTHKSGIHFSLSVSVLPAEMLLFSVSIHNFLLFGQFNMHACYEITWPHRMHRHSHTGHTW